MAYVFGSIVEGVCTGATYVSVGLYQPKNCKKECVTNVTTILAKIFFSGGGCGTNIICNGTETNSFNPAN